MDAKTKKRTKKKTLDQLFHRILILENDIQMVKDIFEERDEILEEIFKRTKKAKKITFFDEKLLVEVLEQKGHYVFNKPLRLSVKKVA